jgi:hypothetical protein
MTDAANDPAEIQLSADLYSSPLREMAVEVHEIYEELQAAGFPESVLAQIIAHIVSDTVLYRVEYVEDDEDEDEEDDDTDERTG